MLCNRIKSPFYAQNNLKLVFGTGLILSIEQESKFDLDIRNRANPGPFCAEVHDHQLKNNQKQNMNKKFSKQYEKLNIRTKKKGFIIGFLGRQKLKEKVDENERTHKFR